MSRDGRSHEAGGSSDTLPSSVVIAGGGGFLGRALAAELVSRGVRVRIVDRVPVVVPGAECFQHDIAADAPLAPVVRGFEALVNAAALLPLARAGRDYASVNVGGTDRLCAAAVHAGVRTLVQVSSSIVYGAPTRSPIDEETPLAPLDAYGESKRAAELTALRYAAHGPRVVVLRPRFIVGAGRLGLLGILFDWIARGRRVPIFGQGHNHFQMLALSDAVDALTRALTRGPTGIYNLATAATPTVRVLLESLIARAGSKSRLWPVPPGLARAALSPLHALHLSPLGREHYLVADREYVLDTRRAEAALGWRSHASVETALFEAFEYWRVHAQSRRADGSADHPHHGILRLLGPFL